MFHLLSFQINCVVDAAVRETFHLTRVTPIAQRAAHSAALPRVHSDDKNEKMAGGDKVRSPYFLNYHLLTVGKRRAERWQSESDLERRVRAEPLA